MTKRQARAIGNNIIQEKYPGFYLLMDRITRDAYSSLWGLDKRRVEIVFANRITTQHAYVTEYKIEKIS